MVEEGSPSSLNTASWEIWIRRSITDLAMLGMMSYSTYSGIGSVTKTYPYPDLMSPALKLDLFAL